MAQAEGSANSEHGVASSANSLDAAIQKLNEHSELDDRGLETLAAAVIRADASE